VNPAAGGAQLILNISLINLIINKEKIDVLNVDLLKGGILPLDFPFEGG
jgi:hypothetical protein